MSVIPYNEHMTDDAGRSSASRLASQRSPEVRAALDTIFRDSLRPLTAWLGLLYILFAAGHQLQPRFLAVPMTRLALGTSAVLFASYFVLRRRPLPVRWAYPVGAFIAALALLNSLAHLYLAADPIQTTNLMLLVVGAALLVLSTPWFVLIVVETWIGWGIVAWSASPSPAWQHFGFALIVASVLSAVLHKVRVESFARIELSLIRDQQRQLQLEEALQKARDEVAARESAETRVLRMNEDLECRVQERTLELQETNLALQGQIEASPLAIAVLDTKGSIRAWNPAAERIFGWTHEEVIGRRYPAVPGPRAEELERLFQRVLSGETIRGLEAPWLRKDRVPVDVRLYTTLLRNPAGEPTGVMALIEDITLTKRLEEQLRQSQKMEAIGKLAGGIAHDFNNLLTGILGFSDLILEKVGEDSPLRPGALQIKKAGERAASLTNQLLAFSRRQILQPRVLDLHVVIKDMEILLCRVIGERIELHTDLRATRSRVKIDPGHLEQVIMNLVVNASDAMPKGGRLTLRTSNADGLDESTPPGSEEAPRPALLLSVCDSGVGMDEQTKARVFEPFFTTKEPGKGTGLGLSMVYGIIRQSGGSISVTSEPGAGSTFEIRLPLSEEDAPVEQTAAVDARPAAGSETILLVEDEETVRSLAQSVLESKGYRVMTAAGGPEAISMADDCGGTIDLVLADLVMPQISGPEVVQKVGETHPEARVLYMSGYTESDLSELGISSGAASLLTKPFSPRTLLKAVRETLDAGPKTEKR
jgi:PAS domain S-box-containing protein